MGRIMAIDYGEQRCGIAVSDPLKIIATPLKAVATPALIEFLGAYFHEQDVECIVIGDPKNLDGRAQPISKKVHASVEEVKKKFPEKEIVWIDERFTSKMAQRIIVQSGLKRKARREKSLVDVTSAVLILQSYLESQL